jgi:diguanylate cyclase (GGDEF)-like protein/PAS domain S-box-containing protein
LRSQSSISDALADVLVVADESGVIQEARGPVLPMFGVRQRDMVGKMLSTFIDHDEGAARCCSMQAGIRSVRAWHCQNGEFSVCVNVTRLDRQVHLQIRHQACLGNPLVGAEQSSAVCVGEAVALHEALRHSVNHAFISVGLDGRINFFNQAAQRMLGYTSDEVVGRQSPLLFHDVAEIAELAGKLSQRLGRPVAMDMSVFFQREAQGEVVEGKWTFIRKDGSRFPVLLETMALWGARHEVIGYLGVAVDLTKRCRVAEKLRLSDEVFQNCHEAIMITGADNTILAVNPAFTRITGYTAQEAVGGNPRMLKSGRHGPEFYAEMWAKILGEGVWSGEIWDRSRYGKLYPKWVTINAIRDAHSGKPTHFLAMFSDISERKRVEEKIRFLAFHDALTGLPNRLTLQDKLEQSIADAAGKGGLVALLLVDLDRFKTINDTLGHPVGDRLLVEVAKRIAGAVRGEDTLVRFGGDEFVILLPGLSRELDAAQLASNVSELFVQPFMIDGRELHTASSIGISLYPRDGSDPETLLKNADIAMYHAKAQGGNSFQFYAEEMNRSATEHLALENLLRQALGRDEFELHYQAQICLADQRLIGFEALIRWRHPAQGLVAPLVFIPMAEETGLINRIGEWVLSEACRQAQAWQDAGGPALRMAINLSPRQFRQRDLVDQVCRALAASLFEPSLLELEITEGAVMDSPEKAIVLLRRLREMGVRLALDDFGTGYSSLAYLKMLPFNRLKIDRSFVSDIGVDSSDTAIATATIALAHKLGLEVIAEGIETESQRAFLAAEGCEEGQGYHFSRPIPAAQVADFVAQWVASGRPVGSCA